SRRRHTRFSRDWSSDVCSSDLHVSDRFVDPQEPAELYRKAIDGLLYELGDPHTSLMTPKDFEQLRVQTEGEYGGLGIQIDIRDRSEERRVGKEGRYRWTAGQ